ncbi:MAG: DUF5666 domain-containing protein [Actinomycetota bacterium]|nr:DUF5666 domain-containing protein [Actinomycetota bacterium]
MYPNDPHEDPVQPDDHVGPAGSGTWQAQSVTGTWQAQSGPAPSDIPATNHRSPRRLIATSALAAGLALGGFGVAAAASGGNGSSGSTPAATTNSSSSSSGTVTPPAGAPMGPRGAMRGGPGGVITAISGNTVTFTGIDGQSHSVTTDSSTVYRKDGTKVSSSALAVGEHIVFRPVRPSTSSSSSSTPSTTTPVAAEIDIVSPSIDGTVHSISGSTMVIVDQQGFWRTVDVSAGATVTRGGQASTLSAVKVGDHVRATGTIAADNTTLDATTIRVELPRVGGKVTSVSGSTITVSGPGSTTWTIDTSASTTFVTANGPGSTASSSLSAVTTGSFVDAVGTLQGTTLTATTVTIHTGTGTAGPSGSGGFAGRGRPGFGSGGPGGPGGPGGFGPGPMGGAGTSTGGTAGSGSTTGA